MAQDWVTLTKMIKVAKPTPSFLTKLFSEGGVQYSPVPKVTLRNMDISITAAPLRALYSTAVSDTGNFTWSETNINPPQIFLKMPISEQLLLSQISDPSLLIANDSTVVDNKLFVYATAIEQLKTKILNRIELMCGQILSEGKIQYNDGTYTYTVTFDAPESETVSASSNLLMWLKLKVQQMKENGFSPKYILVSPDVAEALLDNNAVNKALTKSNYAVGTVSLQNEPFVSVVFELVDLPPVLIYSATIGSERTFGATGKVVLVDPAGLGIAYGAVANANLRADMTPIMGDIFAFEGQEPDGSTVNLYAISRPLPYVVNNKAVKIIDVTFS